ncbi:MAG: chromosome segregation protein SMC [Myxococcota bacterium]
MRLKKVEVQGFKSFADRQVIVVDDHVTGVIGPNGCGKSNIVDAVRWAMGEQSAKHLRGTGMADVIFAGCSTRGPGGMAEVTLTFENDGEAPAAHFDARDIAITRRLFADGTSEYLINKVPARLRDITELLMGTGAGTKGYSIIAQGQVGRIVNSKPEERRHIIDEAAGITRFKAQKAAAERKMNATRQNLLRTSDVIAELEARLGTLRRQAQKAERYKRYKTELRDLDLWTAAHKYLELGSTGSVLEGRRANLEVETNDITAALEAREGQMDTVRAELGEVEAKLADHQQAAFDLENRVRLLDAENEYRQRERDGLVQTGAQARAESEAAATGLAAIDDELTAAQEQKTALTSPDGEGSLESQVDDLQTQAREAEEALATTRARIDAARLEVSERRTTLAGATARRQSHVEARTLAAQRLDGLESTLGEQRASAEEAAELHERAEAAVEGATTLLEVLSTRRGELDRARISLREQVASAEVELDTKRAEVHRHRSRLQSLEEIQSRYRGCQSGVQLVMEHRRELAPELHAGGDVSGVEAPGASQAVYGILADYVAAPEHLETAVSAVLGDRLEGVVVDGPEIGARGVELLKREQEGRTTFVPKRGRALPSEAETVVDLVDGVPLGWQAPDDGSPGVKTEFGTNPFEIVDLTQGLGEGDADASPGEGVGEGLGMAPVVPLIDRPGVLGPLADLVEVSAELGALGRSLLGDTVVVDSLDRALALWDEGITERRTLVTLEGDRVEPTGVVVGGSPTALNAALLQQKREIRELQEILASLDESFESARGKHLGLAQELAEVEAAREQSEKDVLEAETTRVQAEAERAQLATEVQRLTEEVARKAETVGALRTEVDHRSLEIAALDEAIRDGRVRVVELATEVDMSDAQVQLLVGHRDQLAGALTEAKVELARWQQQSDAIEATVERLARQAEFDRQRVARLDASAATAQQRVAELDQATEAANAERATLAERQTDAAATMQTTRERFEALRARIDDLTTSMKTLRADLDERRSRVAEVELGVQEINLERQHLLTDIRDRFDLLLPEILIDYHDRPLAGREEKERQKELKRILSRMGEVNLTAIDEYEEVSSRYEYLTTQRDDLEQAIDQLQEAIDKINRTTKDLFKTTFDAVNERFTQLFPRLFGGGSAKLKMTDPTDLLGTGVEIEARPPGKQPRTLALLSGGEQALTAVSLVFAIFLIKPSPFCILDEVDAPLDDANVGRFIGLVRELAHTTQFIFITHNKVSMEGADRLYGVTMEQRGVSKLVSVNLKKAVELAYN